MKKKKILLLIVAISLCVLIISIAAAVKSVKKRNNNKSALTTVEIVSNQTTLTSAVTTEAKATEKTNSETNSVTEEKTQPAYQIDPMRLRVGFQNAIFHYTSLYQGIHTAIGIDYNKDYYDELINMAYKEIGLPSEAILGIYKFKNVKSAAEIEKIYKKYLSDDIVDKLLPDHSNFLIYNNEIYYIDHARWTFDYDASSITYKGEKDGGYILEIDRYRGEYLSTESYLLKYIDGNFKIVKKLGEEQLHPSDYRSPHYSSLLIFDW